MDKVVFLAHRTTGFKSEYIEKLSCAECNNKTYTVEYDALEDHPKILCACCKKFISKIGFIEEK